MKTLEEIKALMAAGETARAAEALKEVLAKEPENLQAKMLYGTCCQLLGDEETLSVSTTNLRRRWNDAKRPSRSRKPCLSGASTTHCGWH